MKRYRLMIPGPIDIDPEVLHELSRPLVAHYGAEWTAYYKETTELTKALFQTQGDVFLIPGSGSAGLDAVLGSLLGSTGKGLVISSGWFAERLYQIASSYSSQAYIHRLPTGTLIGAEVVEAALQQHNDAEIVIVTHCETSTGVLNRVQDIGEVCRRNKVLLVVDAVSSLGSVPMQMDAWNVAACVTSTQKGLEIPPGLAPVAVGAAAWERIQKTGSSGWYLNLRVWRDFVERWGEWHPHPVTIPTGLVEALRKSLELMNAEGLEKRFQRHREAAAMMRQGLKNLGFELFSPDEEASPTVTAVLADDRISVQALQQFLKERYNTLIADGIDALNGKIFRIGHMGPNASSRAILSTLFAIEKALQSFDAPVHDGQALAGLR